LGRPGSSQSRQPPIPSRVRGAEDQLVLDLLSRHGDHSSAFLTFNQDVRHYLSRAAEGVVAYRNGGRHHAVQLCGPIAHPADRGRVFDEFRQWATRQHMAITALQLRRAEADLYATRGFVVNQIGTSYSIAIADFALTGTSFMRIRNKIRRARRLGVIVEELAMAGPDLDAVDAAWLLGKGRHVRELALLVGERGGRGAALRRTFVARLGTEVVAYATYSPVWGVRPGWLYDLTRRLPSAPPGAIELIFVTALERFAEEGYAWIHLGLTPFSGLSKENELTGSASAAVGALIRRIGRSESFYPVRSQETFKRKWHPGVSEPEYAAFERWRSSGAAWHIVRMTRVTPALRRRTVS
jgi:lysylphosphatidylglycerol synthetase-like protein (DUF2156 family)